MANFISFVIDYFQTVLFNWYGILLVIAGALDLFERIFNKKPTIPTWMRTTVLISILLVAQMFAYRDLKVKYDTTAQQQEPLQIGHYSLGPSASREKPGVTAYDFIVQTNRVLTSVRLAVNCDHDIVDAYSRLLGVSTLTLGGLDRIDNRKYEISISAPAWRPSTPLLVTLYGEQTLNCSFSQG
jgi:hypothetical protein